MKAFYSLAFLKPSIREQQPWLEKDDKEAVNLRVGTVKALLDYAYEKGKQDGFETGVRERGQTGWENMGT